MYTAMGMTLGITSVLIIIMEIFAPYLAGVFTEDTEAIYYAGIKYPNRSYRSAFLQCVYDTTFPCHRSRSYFVCAM